MTTMIEIGIAVIQQSTASILEVAASAVAWAAALLS
jgi:hypothetical protein